MAEEEERIDVPAMVTCSTNTVRRRWLWRIWHLIVFFHVWHKCIRDRPLSGSHGGNCMCKCAYMWPDTRELINANRNKPAEVGSQQPA